MNFRKYYQTVLKICYCTYFSDPHNKYICTGNEVGWTCKDITLKKKKIYKMRLSMITQGVFVIRYNVIKRC